jgi:hypothetical protein
METILMSVIILIAFIQSIRVIKLRNKLFNIEKNIRKSKETGKEIELSENSKSVNFSVDI